MSKILNEITSADTSKILELICSSDPRRHNPKVEHIRKNSGKAMSGVSNNASVKIMKSGVIAKRW